MLLSLLLFPVVVTWPLVRLGGSHVLAAPDQEAATHIWGLWAALHEGTPVLLQTRLMAWPSGIELVLVDPGHLPWFALGNLLSPAAGYAMVLYMGVVIMGLAGALLAREARSPPWVGALVAMACPTVVANAADGMTEGFGVGWVGLQLALLLAFSRRGGWALGLAATLAFAWTWTTGPYNGVWAAMCDLALGIALLARVRRLGWRPAGRALGVGLGAALLVSPLGWIILTHRPDHLPGSGARSGLPAVVENAGIYRGGMQTGADLQDAWLPVQLTGAEADPSHTTYLGVGVLLLALLAVARQRRLWPWLAGAVGFVALSWGPWLYSGGAVLRLGEAPLMGPAGLLMLALPPLGRITRWYRAGAVATLLLAPLVASLWSRERPLLPAWSALFLPAWLVLELALLAPLAWPLSTTPLPDVAPYAALEGEGAILELPPATTGPPPLGKWRDRIGVVQPQVGRPVGGAIMNIPPSDPARGAQSRVEELMRTGKLSAKARQRVVDHGFRWVAILPPYRPVPAEGRAHLEACLGSPLAETEEVWLFALEPVADCP